MKTKIKICGIKTLEEALISLRAGVDYLGFNFVTSSPRYITPKAAKKIIDSLPEKRPKTVGVFRNETEEKVLDISKGLVLDLVQLHGDEDESYCRKLSYIRLIKVFPIVKAVGDFPCKFIMVDREIQGQGNSVDFRQVVNLRLRNPLFLAGGLTTENIRLAVSIVKPYAVDVAGGVETNGKKDFLKIKNFIEQVRIPL